MSNLEKEPSQEKGSAQSDDQRVGDIEQARVGAYAEKPVRELALEEGVSEEEKAILDRLAERHGEKAMQEYADEKGKNLNERLLARIDKIAAGMRKKGLEQDAIMVEKIKSRFDEHAKKLRAYKEYFEQKSNRHASPGEIRIGIDPMQINMVGNQIFSKQGKTEFYRGLGALGEDEEVIDFPMIYQKALREEREEDVNIDPLNYRAHFPTTIEGVNVFIERGDKYGEFVTLGLENEFIEAILAEK